MNEKIHRRAFATRLTQLMLEGGSSTTNKAAGRWTDKELARALTQAESHKREFAPNTVGNWRKGTALPDSIAPLIAVFFGDSDAHSIERQSFQDLFSEARLEKWGPLKAKAIDRAAPVFVPKGKVHAIDRTLRETDLRTARNEKIQTLQANVRRSAERLAENVEERGTRYSNTPIWRELAKEARRLAEIAALEPQVLITKLSDAYGASLYLGGRIDLDDRVIARQTEDPPLDLDVRGDLVHLVRLAAPWLRAYPSVRTLDDQAARSLTNFGDTQAALGLVETAARIEAISHNDAEVMRTLDAAAQDPDFKGLKARRRLLGGAGNLALALASTEAERQADALDLSNAETRALAESTRATLLKAGPEIDRLPMPEDVRAALRGLVTEALAKPVAIPALADVEDRARELILQGVAPPTAWRPWIRRLDFSGTRLADVTPLAALTRLTWLDLSNTQVADATPLAALTALKRLDLSNTNIADATPLAVPTKLAALDQGDITPAAALTALAWLNLGNARIADATPLGMLLGLTWLDLSNTPIVDATPLAALTALKRLDLSNTNIADATPLATLTALERLDLSNTNIADATPLAALNGVKWLDLRGTRAEQHSRLLES